jgi:predicted RNA binding protein YcfA (HicA-like mRNA interferase family)
LRLSPPLPQRLSPCSRSEFIRKLRNLGFSGPYQGGDHEFMSKLGHANVKIPNPHGRQGGGIGIGILQRVLRDSDISRDDWDKA